MSQNFEIGQKVVMMLPVECTIIEKDGKFMVVRIDDCKINMADFSAGRCVEVPECAAITAK